MIKLCFLASSNSIHSYRWIKYFADSGFNISWISLTKNSFDKIPNVEYIELNSPNIFKFLWALMSIRRIVNQIKPDIIHAHSVGSYGLLALCSGAKSIISTPWGSDVIFGKKSILKRHFISSILNRSTLITCDAHHMKEELHAFGVENNRIKIINFGIDTEKFKPLGKNQALLKEYGLSNQPIVISLRNFEPVYDVETLLHAIPIILKKHGATKFLIVGRGSLESKLKELSHYLKIDKSIIFIGFIQNSMLPSLLSSSDIYVSTSLSDAGIAASTAEAMACGLPVVVTNSGENSYWIQDAVDGFLVPIKSPHDLAEKIISLIENNETRSLFGALGRKKIVELNDFYNEMNKMKGLYKDVFNKLD